MEIVRSNCPDCGSKLEFPLSSENLICRECGAAYKVSYYKSVVNLHRIDSLADKEEGDLAAELEDTIREMEEQIAEVKEEIDTIRSREQGAALQTGCAAFGFFGAVIMVLAVFVTVARGYFGGWLFYSVLAAVLFLAGLRVKRRLVTKEQRKRLAEDRREMEEILVALEADHQRLTALRQ